ncbi:NAD-dependent epimerase/dehydratase family protein [Pelomicrobium sp. G1]|uniref:NAD-dependent epimerase/dehydratase family protein n=1 Tax=unclassified Pelomicrobium TaxID=2815318 RepID=UPI003F76F5E4
MGVSMLRGRSRGSLRRLIIVGCGDVGLRLAARLSGRYRLLALTHSPARHALLRARGVAPLPGDLDRAASLARLGGVAHALVHLAPPPGQGARDTRTMHLLAALGKRGMLPQTLVYISTSGVYGDCGGALVPETRPVNPATARARRRVDAEERLRAFGRRHGVRVVILRVPGIYSGKRLPLERLRARTPALVPEEDSYSNHIHADDLAAAVAAALARGRPGRVYNVSDDSELRMGDYFDRVADRRGLARPPRIRRGEAPGRIPETLLSFMNESRRLVNARMKRELRLKLRYPTVDQGLEAP